ncbi:hypothetical protein BS47DRAFT_542019 [Hydnum rufescens UP504]|uniref:Cyclin N-terminal domain-containing protein n=1 Tax=Hydnum rufescens UP504 TaxID=1448309 RepID=A0A9P6B3T1_9AGAM|nr:hypothetical protein BS47DRAFT_542019 [Hydnum rufescens UP504]
MLSLWFIQRLPVGKTNGEVQTEMERSFRDDLLASKNEIPWRLLVLGLTLSNKWLEDNTFTTKTWHEVTGLSIASMRSIESKALALFSWILGPHPDQWLSWLRQLRRRELTTVNAIGSERDGRMTNPPTKKPFQVIDELIAEVCAAENHAEPVFAITSPDSAILDDFDSLNDTLVSSPLPSPHGLEVHLHSRAASFPEVGSAAKIVEGLDLEPRPNSAPHDVHYPRRLKTPALWDPASTVLDSPQPPSKPRPMYEAIQRPFVAPPVPPAPQLQQYDDAYAAVHGHEYVYGPAGQVGIGSGAQQALVIPRYFDHTYGIGNGDGEPSSFSVRLTYENESRFHSDDTSYPRHEPERSWYDTRLPRSIAESHIPSSWTAFSGMFRI